MSEITETIQRALLENVVAELVAATENEICELNLLETPTAEDERRLTRLYGELEMALRISERFNLQGV